MARRNVFVTGANGYIGNAVATAFVREGWMTYGLIRSPVHQDMLAAAEIIPVIGSIDSVESYEAIHRSLPATMHVIVSTTENTKDYLPHFLHILQLVRTIATLSIAKGVRPLVIFTCGSKDYGVGPHLSGTPNLEPHTEESPLRPPPFAKNRVKYAPTIFQHSELFHAVLVRPTNVYGGASSYYSAFFRVAAVAALNKDVRQPMLSVPARPDWICHALHVDDCADAFVAIAMAPLEAVSGQVFNISSSQYETTDQILKAVLREYGLNNFELRYSERGKIYAGEDAALAVAVGFPQWTSSHKLRAATGWSDRRMPFSEGIRIYRLAYEAAERTLDENVTRIGNTLNVILSTIEPFTH